MFCSERRVSKLVEHIYAYCVITIKAGALKFNIIRVEVNVAFIEVCCCSGFRLTWGE